MSEWGSDNGDDAKSGSLGAGGSDAGSEKREPVTYEPEYNANEDENLYGDNMNKGTY